MDAYAPYDDDVGDYGHEPYSPLYLYVGSTEVVGFVRYRSADICHCNTQLLS